ncbi:MAG: hypothetical protein JWR24_4854 [Actinoallomurus sp.]|nr:hypothetical protein [Actinoallomurus sp.]
MATAVLSTNDVMWRKSLRSQTQGDQCVEVAITTIGASEFAPRVPKPSRSAE